MPSDEARRALDKALDSLRAASEAAALGTAYTCGPPWFTWNYGVLVGSPDPHAGTLIADTDTTAFEGLDRDDIDRDANATFIAEAWNFARLILSRSDLIAALRAPSPEPGDAGAEAMRERCAAVAWGHAECMEGNPPTSGERIAREIAAAIRALPLATPAPDQIQGDGGRG